MTRRALITGITGQDGSYLAELLIKKGYEVYGLIRRTSGNTRGRIEGIEDSLYLVDGDLLDQNSLIAAITEVMPHEVYNLGAQSFVPASNSQPVYTAEVNGLGVVKLLEAIRLVKPDARFYQASTSEMFGKVHETPQNEETPFHPRSPYGVSKVFAHYAVQNYREAYDMFAVSGILFNHESPRRGSEFVTRKITTSVARIKLGLADHVELGNLYAKRDWGFAGDYVEAMWMMLNADTPQDFVVGTGETHSVMEFLITSAHAAGFDLKPNHIQLDPSFKRPAEVDLLCADSSKIRKELQWSPKTSFDELVGMMVRADIERIENAR